MCSGFDALNVGTEDKERSGQSKKFEDEEFEALLDEDPSQTEEELAKSMRVERLSISKRLHTLGLNHRQGKWVPYRQENVRSTWLGYSVPAAVLSRHYPV